MMALLSTPLKEMMILMMHPNLAEVAWMFVGKSIAEGVCR